MGKERRDHHQPQSRASANVARQGEATLSPLQTTVGNAAISRSLSEPTAVVAGRSAEGLLDTMAGRSASAAPSTPAVQRKDGPKPLLPPYVEPMLAGVLRAPVAEGDMKAARVRADVFLAMVRAMHRPVREILLQRFEDPQQGDELARLFKHQFATASRNRVLAVLRDQTPARSEGGGDGAKQAGSDVGTSAKAQDDPWQHMFGEASTPVKKLGRIQAANGLYLREKPIPGSPANAGAPPVPFNSIVMVERRTTKTHSWWRPLSTAAERWCYVVATENNTAGFCEERFLAIDPPEPQATLHLIQKGETLGAIATHAYGKSFKGGNDERLYVQGLYEANKDRPGVKLQEVSLSTSETWHRKEDEEETLKVYRGVKILEGMSIWIPSEAFIQRLKVSGAITSGSSEFSKAWRAAKEFVDDAIEAIKYGAGFIVGLLEGAWDAIVDLFKGAVEMIETVATMLYHLVTGNPGRIKDMLMGWVTKMKTAWEHRGELADEFMRKWNAEDAWDRGRFQGEVLGCVMMTVLIIIVTAGSGSAASAGSLAARFPQIVKLLKVVDAAGDISTYLGGAVKAVKLPGKAIDHVTSKLGKAGHLADDATDTVGDAAKKGNKLGDAGKPAPEPKDHARDAKDKAPDDAESVAKVAVDGHTIKVLSDGRIVRCSPRCIFLLDVYHSALDAHPELQAKLSDIRRRAAAAAAAGDKAAARTVVKELSVLQPELTRQLVVDGGRAPKWPVIRVGQGKIADPVPVRMPDGSLVMAPRHLPEGSVVEFPDGTRVWKTPTGEIVHDSVVGKPVGQRQGHENKALPRPGEFDLLGYQRLHALGPGTGFESPYGILYGPKRLNQDLQNLGIEGYLRSMNKELAEIAPEYEGIAMIRVRQSVRTKSSRPLTETAAPVGAMIDGATYTITGQVGQRTTPLFEVTFKVDDNIADPSIKWELSMPDIAKFSDVPDATPWLNLANEYQERLAEHIAKLNARRAGR